MGQKSCNKGSQIEGFYIKKSKWGCEFGDFNKWVGVGTEKGGVDSSTEH